MRNEFALSPWTEINRMWNLMDRYWPSRELDLVSAAFPIDMYEQDGRFFVRASVPGVKPEDLAVSLDQGVLTITGESKDNFEERQGSRMFHREHSYGKFVRSVRIPNDVDENSIDAQFENGVLTVSLPQSKPQKALPKQIPIRDTQAGTKPIATSAYADQPKTNNQQPPNREPAGAKK